MKRHGVWRLSFYLRKYVLNEIEQTEGIYYIIKRKGRRRIDLKVLNRHRENLNNWQYWDKLINQSKDSIFKIAQNKHESGSLISKQVKEEKIVLTTRQKYAFDQANGRILDLGCFDGKLLCYLILKNRDCYGVDFNNHYLEIVKNKLKRIKSSENKVKKGLFQDIPFHDDSFDTVISQETLEHFYFPDVMLREIKRVLKPGGRFVGSAPLENRIDSPSHIIYYTYPGLKKLISEHFVISEMMTIKSKPTNKKDNLIIWTVTK